MQYKIIETKEKGDMNMNQNQNESNGKINKVLYIVTVTLLLAIAVVIAITTAANRREKPHSQPKGSDTVMETEMESEQVTVPITTEGKKETEKPVETKKEEKENEKATLNEEEKEVSAIPSKFILPTTGILSKKHDTNLQVYSATMEDYRIHTGIDIVTSDGASVFAAADGTVSQIWKDPLMGSCIAISHSGDCYTVYKNLSENAVEGIEEGVKVSAGQLIASVGNTAMIEIAEEPHLHFEMTIGGKAADPLEYFDESALVSLSIDSSFES